MAEAIVFCVLEQFSKLAVKEGYKLAVAEAKLLKGIHEGFEEIKDELESIKACLKDADTRAAEDDGGGGVNEGLKAWVKQVREASFRIEDVIDKYVMYFAKKGKSMKKKHDIASEIQKIKKSVRGIKERSLRYQFNKSENGSGSSRGVTQNENFGDPRIASHLIKETQVVGFEKPRQDLVDWLVEGTDDLKLVSVVGMGGLGKTTLAKIVFDNQSVKKNFDCRAFITVSQTYNVRDLLMEMIKKFCKESNERIPKDLREMDKETFITRVSEYLELKRYLVLFDDVWTEKFSQEIKHALVNNKKGSRIIVTTRNMNVAESFKTNFHVDVHKLQCLPEDKAYELFCKKVFGGQCPTELKELSIEIVKKCGGLPLAIVAIGGLLSTKPKNLSEWTKLSENLRIELERNVHLTSLDRILSLSYDDLPYHLKPCMLYFGIYPEDYTINRKRLTRQWMAEGFVYEKRLTRPLEDVAEEYLTELIQRSLVNASIIGFDGKVKSCQVHDVLREVIITKMEDLSFCHLIHKDDEQHTVTRRFSIAAVSNKDLINTSNSGIRAIFVFDKSELPIDFMDGLSAKFKLLKVLDFQNSLLSSIPNNLGNLSHLRYLNLSHTKVTVLPKSIGMLVNLETLDLRQTKVRELPKEINKLTKLRLLPVYYRKYEGQYSMLNFTDGLKMKKGIGCLKSLQKLYFLEASDPGGEEDLIQELEKLTQLRKLGIKRVQQGHANALCAAIQEMKHLESLNIGAKDTEEILGLDLVSADSAPPRLRVLNLKCKLTKLPNWIPNLKYLVKLRLGLSNFAHDPLDSLKSLQNLLRLNLWDDAFAGESLHFKVGGFLKLKEIDLTRLNKLSSMFIDEKALPCLEHFRFKNNPQLKVLPQDLENLKKLQFLGFAEMPDELVDSIDPEKDGSRHWVINHIPFVQIRRNFGSQFHEYKLHRIPTQINV
ncbi:disease resistance protein RPM1 [Trifolium repens]|nr:disease resistance protein RPM1 [Trifolium repens]